MKSLITVLVGVCLTIHKLTFASGPVLVIPNVKELLPFPGSNDCGRHTSNEIDERDTGLEEYPWIARLEYANSDSESGSQ